MEIGGVSFPRAIETPSPTHFSAPPAVSSPPRGSSMHVVPSLSPPTATYGPRGEFPRPLLIALTYPTPTQAPFSAILPRREGKDKEEPALPPAYQARLAGRFRSNRTSPLVDAVR